MKNNLLDRPQPREYIEKWGREIRNSGSALGLHAESVIVFRLLRYWFAWPIKNVQTISQTVSIKKIPHRSNDSLKGMAKVLGQFHLVIALEVLLKIRGIESIESESLAMRRKAYPRAIVAIHNKETFVFIADDLVGVHYLRPECLQPVTLSRAGKTIGSYSKGFFEYKNKSIIFLDHLGIFNLANKIIA